LPRGGAAVGTGPRGGGRGRSASRALAAEALRALPARHHDARTSGAI